MEMGEMMQTASGILKKDLGGYKAGSGMTAVTIANDDGSYRLLVQMNDKSKVLDETYTDKAAYQAAYIDIMDPAETDGAAPSASTKSSLKKESLDTILQNIMKGNSVRESVMTVIEEKVTEEDMYDCTECEWSGPESELDGGMCPECGAAVSKE